MTNQKVQIMAWYRLATNNYLDHADQVPLCYTVFKFHLKKLSIPQWKYADNKHDMMENFFETLKSLKKIGGSGPNALV